MRFLIVIQARLNSSRLPKKVLEPIGDMPLLLHIAKRMAKTSLPFVFAVPQDEEHSQLTDFFDKHNLAYILGSEADVYSRYVYAARELADNDYVVRLTGDNPFLDYKALQIMYQLTELRRPEYAHSSGLPLGMGFEVVQKAALLRQEKMNMQPYHHEHVTLLIREQPQEFDFYKVELFANVPQIRMTVDEAIDLQQARDVYNYFLQQKNPYFTSWDVYSLYKKNPAILQQNSKVEQRKK